MRRIGKQGKINLDASKKLKEIYGPLKYCEPNLKPCVRTWTLAFAHRRKRYEYYKCPELLGTYAETLVACTPCHELMENNKPLTEELFNHYRPSTRGDEYHQMLIETRRIKI